jgi:DNA-nicking Smr family endonuclease
MRTKKLPQAEDEADLFREAVKDVTPLRGTARVTHVPPRPAPLPLQRQQDDRQVLQDSLSDQAELEADLESGDVLAYVRPGLSTQVLRRLRGGHWAVQQELDLHGMRSDEARTLLVEFLGAAVRRGQRCVRVIHGKGRRSQNGEPVLKRKVAVWLAQRGDVLAYCEARPAEGGAGAVMVLLQGQRSRSEAQEDE